MALRNAPIRVIVAAAASALIATAPAAASPADDFPAHGEQMAQAYDQARGYWQGTPCGGQVRIAWAAMDKELNALAKWTTTDVSRPETYTDCSITFNTAQPYDYPMLCSVMAHEIGHLLGQPHGGNQEGSVMSETYYGPVGPCGPASLPEPPPPDEDATARSASATSAASKRKRICVRRLRAKNVTAKAAQRRCSTKRSTKSPSPLR